MFYEGLSLGLAYLWNGLRHEVSQYAADQAKAEANEEQKEEIDNHTVNTVPQDDEPTETFDDGTTSGIADEGASADM